jgi:3-hydroxybutyryl-CoA dehydrogenase
MNQTVIAIRSICVCGAGTMGSGIAQVAAQHGYRTVLFDTNAEALNRGKSAIKKNLRLLAEKNKISTAEQSAILEKLNYTASLDDCKADLIIEAIIEELYAKRMLFRQLATINDPQCIFATNTSSLSVTEIAAALEHPEKVAGLHFFNPPALMKLVEVVRGRDTSEQVIRLLIELVKSLGKIAVLCGDAPGFIVNRVARPYYLEALKLLELGISDFETIDRIMEASGFRMGPFRLMDLIGNDINLSVTLSLHEAYNRPTRFKPSPIQIEKVKNLELGRKTGKGYYDY